MLLTIMIISDGYHSIIVKKYNDMYTCILVDFCETQRMQIINLIKLQFSKNNNYPHGFHT